MATIRLISCESFNADASNMGIMLDFMANELKLNEREINRHHPVYVTFNNRGNPEITLSLWPISHQEKQGTSFYPEIGT